MRFLRLLKRNVLITIFIFGLLTAFWLAFFAKPAPEFIGQATAATSAESSEPKRIPISAKPSNPPASTPVNPLASATAVATTASNTNFNLSKLIIPVSGVRPEQLHDSYSDARSEGRTHNALDIKAQKGTPVLATADGVIKRIFYSERGGKTLYQLSADGKTVYYYAHLDGYASDISQDRPVKQGEVIAYVGDTGNAGSGNYHLHFAIWTVENPKRIWEGNNINPYPLLR